MPRRARDLLDRRTIQDVAISTDGRIGALVSHCERPRQKGAVVDVPIIIRLGSSETETLVLHLVMGSDWPRELTQPLYRWKLEVTEALPVFSTVAVGEYLERSSPRDPQSSSALFGIKLADVIDTLCHRREATYDEILAYLKAKVFWSWQFHHPFAIVSKADLLRLATRLRDVNEVATQRVGEFWSITNEGNLKPTGHLIDLMAGVARKGRAVIEERVLAAILFADMVESTRIMSDREDLALQLVSVLEDVARQDVSAWNGIIVKFTGDGVISRFSNVPAAVHCGLDLLEDFAKRSSDLGHHGDLRVGIHIGEVVCSRDGDVHGEVVHTAARAQSIAPPGALVVTGEAWSQLRRSPGFKIEDLGHQKLRSIEIPIQLYRVARA